MQTNKMWSKVLGYFSWQSIATCTVLHASWWLETYHDWGKYNLWYFPCLLFLSEMADMFCLCDQWSHSDRHRLYCWGTIPHSLCTQMRCLHTYNFYTNFFWRFHIKKSLKLQKCFTLKAFQQLKGHSTSQAFNMKHLVSVKVDVSINNSPPQLSNIMSVFI